MDHDCSLLSVCGPEGAGSHSLIRDTVEPTDDYETIHNKHWDFFK